ncbi:putative methyltransferase DDB_G0268948 [Amphiura filiformis]|uniref:putative methyltransferase DDB_G0268948 n=1 Tax=Amphiura filiformis TaxID=82378 RepID=UPI003B219894
MLGVDKSPDEIIFKTIGKHTMASLYTGLKHASLYSKYRPKPSAAVINKILEFLKEKKKASFLSAVDVGCGSGQSTPVLGEYFESVLGCDISEAQVNEARKANTAPNIKYCVADAEHIPVADNSVDLVTCSMAVHWFDFPAFCKEVDRVLKPSGCLAVYARNHGIFLHDDDKIAKKLNETFSSFYCKTLNSTFSMEILRGIYQQELVIPYPEFERHVLYEHKDVPLLELLGLIETFSGYQKYHKEHPNDDILKPFQNEMIQMLGVDKSPDEIIFNTECPIFLLLGRKP